MTENPGFGWRADQPDFRDYCAHELLRATMPTARPASHSMVAQMPAIYNQRNLGSCVSQGVRRALQFTGVEMGGDTDLPSSLYIYYNGRMIQGTVNDDSGLAIRTGMQAVAKYGYCDETLVPYNIPDFKKKPSKAAYAEGAKKALRDSMYARVPQTLDAIRDVLASNNPIVFGFTVYSSFNRVGRNGLVPLPAKNEKISGGHCVVITGYDDGKKLFTIDNSWGTSWGDSGRCYFTYDHIANTQLCSDFWTVIDVPRLRAAQSSAAA